MAKGVSFTKLFSKNHGHGNALIIKAGVRKGKTTLMSLIAKKILEYEDLNFAIISNIRFTNEVYEKYKDKLFFIKSLGEYFYYYSEIPYSNPIILLWDDAQASEGMTSKDVMSKSGKKLAKLSIMLGKMETSFIYCAHQDYIPKALMQGYEPLYIYKKDRTEMIISFDLFESEKTAYYHPDNFIVPLPKPLFLKDENGELVLSKAGNPQIDINDENYLPILSTAFTTFDFNDIDLDDLNNTLSDYDVGENLKECISEYLKGNKIKKDNNLDELKNISYENLYISMCLKKGYLLSDGEILRDIINPNMINMGRKKLKKIGLDFKKS